MRGPGWLTVAGPAGNKFVAEALIRTVETRWPELAIHPCAATGSCSNSGSRSGMSVELPWHDRVDADGHQVLAAAAEFGGGDSGGGSYCAALDWRCMAATGWGFAAWRLATLATQ
jgi:hypothetical protein